MSADTSEPSTERSTSMIPSEYGSVAPTASKSSRTRCDTTISPPSRTLRAFERACEELQLRELDVLVDALEDAVHVGTRLDEIRRETQRLRRRVRVLEPARVGHERDVQGLGDVGRERDAQLADHVCEHLAGRRCVRDDEVQVAEARVVVVVVDVDREPRGVDDARLRAHAARARAVDGDEDTLAEVGRALALEPALLSSRNRYSPGSGAGPPRNMTTSLPSSRSARPIANSEPSASPSGASCDVTTKRSFS